MILRRNISHGDGFVIARAVHVPKKRDNAMNFHWYRNRHRATEERAST